MAKTKMVYVLLEDGQVSPVGVFNRLHTPYLIPADAEEVRHIKEETYNATHREIVGEWTVGDRRYRLVAYVLQNS